MATGEAMSAARWGMYTVRNREPFYLKLHDYASRLSSTPLIYSCSRTGTAVCCLNDYVVNDELRIAGSITQHEPNRTAVNALIKRNVLHVIHRFARGSSLCVVRRKFIAASRSVPEVNDSAYHEETYGPCSIICTAFVGVSVKTCRSHCTGI